MKRNHLVLIKRLLAYGLAANLAAQPAFAQVTISQLPLASAGGNNIVPNLLFTIDVTSAIQDRRYCNSNGVCMRNGQTDSAPPAPLTANTLVSGTDDVPHAAMSAGQFPYRTNRSNASFKIVSGAQTMVFGLPEM